MTDKLQQLHATVYGRVQGVSFRYYTVLKAKESGVCGWVCNLDDGSVEVVAEGSRDQLEGLLVFLRTGPIGAHVVKLDVEWREAGSEYNDFNVR